MNHVYLLDFFLYLFYWCYSAPNHLTILQAVGLAGQKDPIRFDLTRKGVQVEKTKVGPLGYVLFDSAVSISSGPK